MKLVVWSLVSLLLVLHHDFWFWNSDRLAAGFIPVAMLYQMGISLAAAIVWYMATVFAWPDLPDEPSNDGGPAP